MKKTLAAILFICCSHLSSAQTDNPLFNKSLADSLGGDDYGMKSYILCILKTGPNKTEDQTILDSLFKGHMNNIGRMADEGMLVVAGPLKKNDKNYRGIFILNVATPEEAEALLQTDPAIKAKIFDTEIFQWYGSAALPAYLEVHEMIQKKNF